MTEPLSPDDLERITNKVATITAVIVCMLFVYILLWGDPIVMVRNLWEN